MARATLDTFITADEAKLQLGLEGATLDQSVEDRINVLRATALEDLEDAMELMLLGKQRSFEGRIQRGSDKPFSVPLVHYFESVASLLYRTSADDAHQRNGQINVADLKIESTAYEGTGGKLFLVYPKDKWPADAHEDGDALLTINAGIDTSLVPLVLPARHKEYLLLQLSGYFDSRITSGSGKAMPLDHALASTIGRKISKGVTPMWEKMRAAAMAADRIGARA